MHTLVMWAAALALTPLLLGVTWEILILLRKAVGSLTGAPTGHPVPRPGTATPRVKPP